jgi:hypothetical protein
LECEIPIASFSMKRVCCSSSCVFVVLYGASEAFNMITSDAVVTCQCLQCLLAALLGQGYDDDDVLAYTFLGLCSPWRHGAQSNEKFDLKI